MIVIYKKPTTISLPCGKKQFHKFMPGQNKIDPELWEAIQEEMGEERFANYALDFKVLSEVKAESGKIIGKEVKTSLDVNANEAIELVKAITTIEDLKAYTEGEHRVSVLKAIEAQKEIFVEHDKKDEDDD